jgi:predicted metal-dependent phosphotriesterase family hydrolase
MAIARVVKAKDIFPERNRMPAINTVLGTCEPQDLGFTLIHEHLTAGFPGWELDNAGFDRKAEVAKAVDKLKEIKGLGVSSVTSQ